jgi:AcrR family transcriptional regulator
VAEASEVSTATLYNYFATKGDLVAAWLRGEIREALASHIGEAGRGERRLRPVLRRTVAGLAEAAASEAELRREAWHEAGRAALEPASHWAEWVDCLAEEQKRERVRGDLGPGALAEIIVDALEGGLIEGLRRSGGADSMPDRTALIEQAIRVRLDLALDGARKRNERVPAP